MSPFFKIFAEKLRGAKSPDPALLAAPALPPAPAGETAAAKKARLDQHKQAQNAYEEAVALADQLANQERALKGKFATEIEIRKNAADAQQRLQRAHDFLEFANVDANPDNARIIVAEAAAVDLSGAPLNLDAATVQAFVDALTTPLALATFHGVGVADKQALLAAILVIKDANVRFANIPPSIMQAIALRQAAIVDEPTAKKAIHEVFDNNISLARDLDLAKQAFLNHLGGAATGFKAVAIRYPYGPANIADFFNAPVFDAADAGTLHAIPLSIRNAIARQAPFYNAEDAMAAVHRVFNNYEATLLLDKVPAAGAALAAGQFAIPVVNNAAFNTAVDSLIGIPRAVKEGIKARNAISAFLTREDLTNAVRATKDAYAVVSRAIVAGRVAVPGQDVAAVAIAEVEAGVNADVINARIQADAAIHAGTKAAAAASLNAINRSAVVDYDAVGNDLWASFARHADFPAPFAMAAGSAARVAFEASVDLLPVPLTVRNGIKNRNILANGGAGFASEAEVKAAVQEILEAQAVMEAAIAAAPDAAAIGVVRGLLEPVINAAVVGAPLRQQVRDEVTFAGGVHALAHAAATATEWNIDQAIANANNAAAARAQIPLAPAVFTPAELNPLEVEANKAGAAEVARLIAAANSPEGMIRAIRHAVNTYAPFVWFAHDEANIRNLAKQAMDNAFQRALRLAGGAPNVPSIANIEQGMREELAALPPFEIADALGAVTQAAYVRNVFGPMVDAATNFLNADATITNAVNAARDAARNNATEAVDAANLILVAPLNASVIAAIGTANMAALGDRAAAKHIAQAVDTKYQQFHAAHEAAARNVANLEMPDDVKNLAAARANVANASVLGVRLSVVGGAMIYGTEQVLAMAVTDAAGAGLPDTLVSGAPGVAFVNPANAGAAAARQSIHDFVTSPRNYRNPRTAIADVNAIIARIHALDATKAIVVLNALTSAQLSSTYLAVLTPANTKPDDLKLIAELCQTNIGVVYAAPLGYDPAAPGNENKLIIKEGPVDKIFEVFSGGAGAADKPVNYFNITAAGLEQRNDDPWKWVKFTKPAGWVPNWLLAPFGAGASPSDNVAFLAVLQRLADADGVVAHPKNDPAFYNGDLAKLHVLASRVPGLAAEIDAQIAAPVLYTPPPELILQAKYQVHLLNANAAKCASILDASDYDAAVAALLLPAGHPDIALLTGALGVGAVATKWNQLRQAALVKRLEQDPIYLKNKIAKASPESIRTLEAFLADPDNVPKKDAKNLALCDILGKDAFGMAGDFDARIAPFINSVAMQSGIDEYKTNVPAFTVKAAEHFDNSGFRAILRDIQKNPEDFQLIKDQILADITANAGVPDNAKVREILAKRNPAIQALIKEKNDAQILISAAAFVIPAGVAAGPRGNVPPAWMSALPIDPAKKEAYLAWNYQEYEAHIAAQTALLVGVAVIADGAPLAAAYIATLEPVEPLTGLRLPQPELLEEDIDLLVAPLKTLVSAAALANEALTRKALVEQDKYRVLREIEGAKATNLEQAYAGVLGVDAVARNALLDALKERILSGAVVFDAIHYEKAVDPANAAAFDAFPGTDISAQNAAALLPRYVAVITANNGYMGPETLKLVKSVGFNTEFQLITDADPAHPENGELLIGKNKKINSTRAGSVLQAITDPNTGKTSFVAVDETDVRRAIEASLASDVKLTPAMYTLLENLAATPLLVGAVAVPGVPTAAEFDQLSRALNSVLPGATVRITQPIPTTPDAYNKFLNEAKVIYSQSILNKLDQVITGLPAVGGAPAPLSAHLNVLSCIAHRVKDLQQFIDAQVAGVARGFDPGHVNAEALRNGLKSAYLLLQAKPDVLLNAITRDATVDGWTAVKLAVIPDPADASVPDWAKDVGAPPAVVQGFLNAFDVDADPAVEALRAPLRQAFRRAALVNLLERSDADAQVQSLLENASYADKRDLQAILANPVETSANKITAIANWLASKYNLGAVADIEALLDTNKVLGFARSMAAVTAADNTKKADKNKEDNLGLRTIAPVAGSANNILETIGYTKNLKRPKDPAGLTALKAELTVELERKLGLGAAAVALQANLRTRLRALYQNLPAGGGNDAFRALTQAQIDAYTDDVLAKNYVDALGFAGINASHLGDAADEDFSIISAAMGSDEQGDVEIQVIKQGAAGVNESTIKSGDPVVTYSVLNALAPADNVSRRFMVIKGNELQAMDKNPAENAEFSDEQRASLKAIAGLVVDGIAEQVGVARKAALKPFIPFNDDANPNENSSHPVRNRVRAEYLFSNPDANSPLCLDIINKIGELQTAQAHRAALGVAGAPPAADIVAADAALTIALNAFKESVKKLASAQELALPPDENAGWLSYLNTAAVGLAGAAIVDGIGRGPLHVKAVTELKTVALRRYFELNHMKILEKLWKLDAADLATITAFLKNDRLVRAADVAGNNLLLSLCPGLNRGANPDAVMNAFIDANRAVLGATVTNIARVVKIVQDRHVTKLDASNAQLAMIDYRKNYKLVLATPRVFDKAQVGDYGNLAKAIDEDPADLTTGMIESVQIAAAKKLLGNDVLLLQAISSFAQDDLRKLLPTRRNPDVYPVDYQATVVAAFNQCVSGGGAGFNFSWHPEIHSLLGGAIENIKKFAQSAYDSKNAAAAAKASGAETKESAWEREIIVLLKGLDIAKLRLIEGIIYGGVPDSYHEIEKALGRDFYLVLQALPAPADVNVDQIVAFIQSNLDDHLCYRLIENLQQKNLSGAKAALDGNKTTDEIFAALTDPLVGVDVKKHDPAGAAPNYDLHEERLFTNGALLQAVNASLLSFKELVAELEELCPGYSKLAVGKGPNDEGSVLAAFAQYLHDNAKVNQLPTRAKWDALKAAVSEKNPDLAKIKSALTDFCVPVASVFLKGNVEAVANAIIKRTEQLKRYNYGNIENAALASALKRINNDQDGKGFLWLEKHSRLHLDDDTIKKINKCLDDLGTLDASSAGLEQLAKALYENGVYLKPKEGFYSPGASTVDDMATLLAEEGLGAEIIRSHNLHKVEVPNWLDKKFKELGKIQFEQNQYEKNTGNSCTTAEKNKLKLDLFELNLTKNILNVLRSRKVKFSEPFSENDLEKILNCLKRAYEDLLKYKKIPQVDEKGRKVFDEKGEQVFNWVPTDFSVKNKDVISRFNELMLQEGFCSSYNASPLKDTDAERVFNQDLRVEEELYQIEKKLLQMSQSEITAELQEMQKALKHDIEPFLIEKLSEESYESFKYGVDASKWERFGPGKSKTTLAKYLADVKLLAEMPSGHPDAQARARKLEKFINASLRNITVKVDDYERVRQYLAELQKRRKLLKNQKELGAEQKTELKLIKSEINAYLKRLNSEVGREKDYKAWKKELIAAKAILDENLYQTEKDVNGNNLYEDGKLVFAVDEDGNKRSRRADEVLESTFRLSEAFQGSSRKILRADLKMELAMAGVNGGDSAKVSGGLGGPPKNLDVAEKVGGDSIRLDDLGTILMESGDRGTFLHRKGTTHVIITGPAPGHVVYDSNVVGGITAGTITGINKAIMNLRSPRIRRDEKGELYLVNDLDVPLKDYKVTVGKIVAKSFMGNSEPVKLEVYNRYANAAVAAAGRIIIPGRLSLTQEIQVPSAIDSIISAFNSSRDNENRYDSSYSDTIDKGIAYLKTVVPPIAIPDEVTKALAAKKMLEEYHDARKTLLLGSFRAVLKEMSFILSNPGMYPLGLKNIAMRAEDDMHLQCLLAAVELAKGLFPDQVKSDTFQADSTENDGPDDDDKTAMMRYQGLVKRGEVPSVDHTGYSGFKDYKINPPYFKYDPQHKESALVRELVESLGYKPETPDAFKKEMEKVKRTMENATGSRKDFKKADDYYSKLGEKVGKSGPDSGDIEALEMRIKR